MPARGAYLAAADSVFDEAWVEARRVSANAIFAECLHLASQHERGLDIGMEHGFAEGVQRAKGRYDILYGFNGNAEFMEVDSRLHAVLAIAVLSIIATAPLGAVLIAVYGPKLLLKDGAADSAGEGGAPSSANSSAVAVPAEEKSTV